MAKHENEVALEILEHMMFSAIFYSRRCEIALRLTIIGTSPCKTMLISSMRAEIKTIRQSSIPLSETIPSPPIPT
jgi:hypothetical protein